MDQLHRNACDACHDRKVKCITDAPGACQSCQDTGRVCIFSPRDEMGRPRKAGRKAKERPAASGKSSASKAAGQRKSVASVPEIREITTPPTPSRSNSRMDIPFSQPEPELQTFSPSSNGFDLMIYQNDLSMFENQVKNFPSMPSSYSSDQSLHYFQPDLSTTLTVDPNSKLPTSFGFTPPLSEHHLGLITKDSFDTLARMDTKALPLDIYRQLSNLLFTLRQECSRPWSNPEIYATDETAARRGHEIFQSASTLCDTLQAVLPSLAPDSDQSNPQSAENEGMHTVFILALTAIAMLLDIYRFLSRTHSSVEDRNESSDYLDRILRSPTPTQRGSMLSNGAQMHLEFSQASFSDGKAVTTAQYLHSLLQLTTMDFHLSRLTVMLGDLMGARGGLAGGERTEKPVAGLEVDELLAEMKRMRDEMRGAIESLVGKA